MAFSSQIPNREFLWNFFRGVDRDNSGSIYAEDLYAALSNGTWNPSNFHMVKKMVKMFDREGRGAVNFEEFGNLWKYAFDWQNGFRSFDRWNAGSIERREFALALNANVKFDLSIKLQLRDIVMCLQISSKESTSIPPCQEI